MNIYVGNLPHSMSEENLKVLFEEFGQVTTAKIVKDWDTGRSRGFGFVEMPSNQEGTVAMEKLNGAEVEGRRLVVNEARSQARQGGGSGHRGGGSGGPQRRRF